MSDMDLSLPVGIVWIITGDCTLRCRHCLHEGKNHSELERGGQLLVADAIVSAKPFIVILSGGEPVLSPVIVPVLRKLLPLVPRIIFTTNGLLAERSDVLDLLKKWKQHVTIQVSIDGGDAAYHDALRGAGAFDAALGSLGTFSEDGLRTEINVTLTEKATGTLEGIFAIAERYRVERLRFGRFVPQSPAHECLELSRDALHQTLLEIAELQPRYHGFAVSLPRTVRIGMNRSGCDASSKCTVLPDGSVTDCIFLGAKKSVLGHLGKNSLQEIWSSRQAVQRREWFRKLEHICQSCGEPFCASPCAALIAQSRTSGTIPGHCPSAKSIRQSICPPKYSPHP